jgi:predicted acetyltransferase
MNVTIDEVPREQKPVLRNLMELYQHDHAEWDGADLDEHGLYGYTYFEHYWTEDGRHPFLVRVDRKLAGFALVRTPPNTTGENRLAEFFIARKYRRRGVGRMVAFRIFDMFPGRWEVTQVANNHIARAFWEQAISQYTKGQYEQTEEICQGERRPKQVFTSRNTDN